MGSILTTSQPTTYARQLTTLKRAYRPVVAAKKHVKDSRATLFRRIKRWIHGDKRWTREVRTFRGVTRCAAIESIYDGDTFTVMTSLRDSECMELYKLRLADIDAPELKLPLVADHRDLHMRAGEHVRDLVRTCLPPGTPLIIDFRKEEKYGRLLGRVFTVKYEGYFFNKRPVKNVDVCKALVDSGLCVWYKGKAKEQFTPTMLRRILRVKALQLH